ncbi:MAG: hypothetical protein JSS43_16415 [Proteobacteria bacterium]|nr:hypothetical protein [Pseudomonadota bacterium]
MNGERESRPAGPAFIRIRFLGAFEAVRADGVPVPPLGRRTLALLTCLAVAEQPWLRDDLASLLWPGRSTEQKRGSLRQEVLRLRRAIGWRPDSGGSPSPRMQLPSGFADIDVVSFRRAAADPTRAAEAVGLYRGTLLQSVDILPGDPYGAWLAQQRAALHTTALDLMLGLLRGGQAAPALARRIVVLDPACEEAHQVLMRDSLQQRDLAGVLVQFRACADALRTQCGSEPSAATRALLDEATIALGTRPAAPFSHAGTATAAGVEWLRKAPDRAPLPWPPEARPMPVVEDRPSLAVLPFADFSLDPLASSVLADGMTEEITNALARIPGFFVTARQSALAYRGLALDARQIASELGVRYLIEGSVEQDGRRMRSNLRLIDGRTGMHLWAESYTGQMHDVIGVRDSAVHRLASRLQPRLIMEEIARAVRTVPHDMDAWTWLQRANGVLLRGRHTSALEQVMEPLQRAIQADPDYAMANALMAAVHAWRAVSQSFPDPAAEKDLARRRADAALTADPENPFVLVHCAEAAIYCNADIDSALAMLETAASRDPNDANGQALLAHMRRTAGEAPQGSLQLIDNATRLSPRDPRTFLWHHYASWCHYRLGALEGMEAASRRSVELYGRYPLSWIGLTCALQLQERHEEAREAGTILRRMRPSFTAEGFFEIARNFYARRFPGQVEREYGALRDALAQALP